MPQGRGKSIFQSGREVTNLEICEIQETVELFPKLSRSELAATLCENLQQWLTASGNYKMDACMKLLEKLERKGLLRLPRKQEEYRRHLSEKPISLNLIGVYWDVSCFPVLPRV